MKYSITLSLYSLVLLGLLLQGAPVGNAFAKLRQSGKLKMSPEAWPQGELEKYWQLQHYATAAWINLLRLGAWWLGRPLEKTRQSPFLSLAPEPA